MTDPTSSRQPDGAQSNLPSRQAGTAWERQVLERLARSALDEQRRARHWGIFFKTLTFVYLFALLFIGFGWIGKGEPGTTGRHTAVVSVDGMIAPDSDASAERVSRGLKEAFEDRNTVGVIVRINSPGGSPVQAGQINQEMRRLRKMYPDTPLYAVVEDICASGGYYVAAAADRIYVDQASLVGSIGVLMNGFGFTGTMEKLGVERRLLTAGENKGFLDPFSPVDPDEREYAQRLLDEIHQQFITTVREGRGNRLKNDPAVFSGLVWTGSRSIEMGLADEMGSVNYVAREVIKAEHVVDFTRSENIAERLARRFGVAAAEAFVRFGGAGIR
ncbi:MAG: S49 family peptidase [Burkholderiales bacterium]|nr:S49 family peptidase [Burkholderiales bacterium]